MNSETIDIRPSSNTTTSQLDHEEIAKFLRLEILSYVSEYLNINELRRRLMK